MGEIVAFAADIEQMGRDFDNAASGVYDMLTQLQQATDHVRHAFHNHPDQVGAALAPFGQLHGTIEQVEQLASALAVTLIDVGRSYRTNDGTIARGLAAGARGRDAPRQPLT